MAAPPKALYWTCVSIAVLLVAVGYGVTVLGSFGEAAQQLKDGIASSRSPSAAEQIRATIQKTRTQMEGVLQAEQQREQILQEAAQHLSDELSTYGEQETTTTQP